MERQGGWAAGHRVPLELRVSSGPQDRAYDLAEWRWALVGSAGLVPVTISENPLNHHPDGVEWSGSGRTASLRLAPPFSLASSCDGSPASR